MNLFGDYDSHHLAESARKGWRRARDHGPGHLRFWLIALVLGVLAAFAAVGFRLSIDVVARTQVVLVIGCSTSDLDT